MRKIVQILELSVYVLKSKFTLSQNSFFMSNLQSRTYTVFKWTCELIFEYFLFKATDGAAHRKTRGLLVAFKGVVLVLVELVQVNLSFHSWTTNIKFLFVRIIDSIKNSFQNTSRYWKILVLSTNPLSHNVKFYGSDFKSGKRLILPGYNFRKFLMCWNAWISDQIIFL